MPIITPAAFLFILGMWCLARAIAALGDALYPAPVSALRPLEASGWRALNGVIAVLFSLIAMGLFTLTLGVL